VIYGSIAGVKAKKQKKSSFAESNTQQTACLAECFDDCSRQNCTPSAIVCLIRRFAECFTVCRVLWYRHSANKAYCLPSAMAQALGKQGFFAEYQMGRHSANRTCLPSVCRHDTRQTAVTRRSSVWFHFFCLPRAFWGTRQTFAGCPIKGSRQSSVCRIPSCR
jgi:hypothetical protein